MAVLFANNAATTLASAITNVATSITVSTGAGASFPAITAPDFFYATLIDSSNNIEIVKVTARTTDTMTVVRAQEGTTARAYAIGDKFELRITAAGLGNKLDKDTGGTVAGMVTFSAGITFGSTTAIPLASGTTNFTVGTANFAVGLQVGGVAVVGTTAAQTLTNKTIDTAGPNTIKVNGNTLAATAGTATVTLPNSTDTLMGRATTDTMTNKTMSGGTVNADVSLSDTGTIAANSPGFRGLPRNAQTTAYTLALTDQGKQISITTGGITIPANASVAFPIGTTIVIFNNSATSQNIAITTDTLYLAGNGSTGTRAIAGYGLATAVKVDTTTWVISGAGVS